jgi:hypothetical protein
MCSAKCRIFISKHLEKFMSLSGAEAVEYLEGIYPRVSLLEKDRTDKFWSYRIRSKNSTEFAFDPNTKTSMFARVDRLPPPGIGLIDIKDISRSSVSTALKRVFSGSDHKAKYKVTINDSTVLERFIKYYENM